MGILRPATPGFLITLAATACLAIVVFCVPYFHSIYFLKASFSANGQSGYITLGTLGYCFNTGGSLTCSKAAIGYEFDPNKLLGNELPVQIPSIVVKWLTDALVLHVVALVLAAVAAVFGLLAHVREMSMSCLSSCISGLGAFVTLIAFAFDLAFFFIAKDRINKVQGGSAQIGNAVWLTLAAWILLFFSGCFYSIGRCCLGGRGGSGRSKKNKDDYENGGAGTGAGAGGLGGLAGLGLGAGKNSYADDMRLEAVKAEADRKARAAAQKEVGLPAFQEYERTPLNNQTAYMDEDQLYSDNAGPRSPSDGTGHAVTAAAAGAAVGAAAARRQPSAYSPTGSRINRQPSNISSTAPYPGGYASGPQGGRAVDNYYNSAPAPAAAPPSQSYGVGAVYGASSSTPQRQPSYNNTGYQSQYAAQNAPAQSNYADPYGSSLDYADVYDPYAATPPTRPQAAGYNNSSYAGQSSYYTATDSTPRGYDTTPNAYASYPPNTSKSPNPVPLGAAVVEPIANTGYFSPPPQHPTRSSSNPNSTPASPPQQAAGALYGARPQRQPSAATSAGADWNPIAGTTLAQSQSPPQSQSFPQQQPQQQHHDIPLDHSAYGGEEGMSQESEALPSYNPYEPGAAAAAAAHTGYYGSEKR